MGVITVMLKSGDVRHFEVNDTEKALIICETGWLRLSQTKTSPLFLAMTK